MEITNTEYKKALKQSYNRAYDLYRKVKADYVNVQKEYWKMIKRNEYLEVAYDKLCTEHSKEIQALNEKFAELYEKIR